MDQLCWLWIGLDWMQAAIDWIGLDWIVLHTNEKMESMVKGKINPRALPNWRRIDPISVIMCSHCIGVPYCNLSIPAALSAMALSIPLFHITPTVSAYSFVSTFLYIPIYQCLSGSCQKYEYIRLFALSNPFQRCQSVPFLHFFVGVPLFR